MTRGRRGILVSAAAIAFACWSWAMHMAVLRTGFYRTLDGKDHVSLEHWTVGTYCWAAVGLLSFGVFVAAVVGLMTGWKGEAEPRSHGFPIR